MLPIAMTLTYALGIIVTTVTIGFLLEGRHIAGILEVMRVSLFGGAFAASSTWFGFESPSLLRFAIGVFALASVIWLVPHARSAKLVPSAS